MTLTLSSHGRVMVSAYCFTEGKTFFTKKYRLLRNFNENCLKDLGDMERTRNARLKHVILNCDLDLRSVWLSSKSCTPSLLGEHCITV